ncbi:MAG: ribosome biogenesis GTPase Der [candidate division WOR-3 bacterium]
MSNIIVIIGRPNVGKSTLFNRLVGRKLALVHKVPGVTRDRIYGTASWRGRSFEVVDTGGLLSSDDSFYSAKIKTQVTYALQEARATIFLVDGKIGLHPEDTEISKMLHKSGVPFIVAVNKIDNTRDRDRAAEFFALGKEKVIPISAEHGIGVDELLDEIIKIIPEEKPPEWDQDNSIRLLILGRPNVGKSTLFNRILNRERAIVDERPGTTRDLLMANFKYKNQNFIITDSAGLRKKSKIKETIEIYSVIRAINHIDRCDIALLLIEIAELLTNQDKKIADLVITKNKGLIIAVNKIDLAKVADQARISRTIYASAPFLKSIPIITISALKGIRIDLVLDKTIEIFYEQKKWVDRSALKSLIKGLLQPPGKARLYDLKQTSIAPPTFVALASHRLSPEYLRYLKNTLHNYFGLTGNPITIKTRIVGR